MGLAGDRPVSCAAKPRGGSRPAGAHLHGLERRRGGAAERAQHLGVPRLAAGAVGGKSGSKAAKKGAGVGVIAAAGRNSRNRREASANASAQTDQIVKNCMAGRGYNVLN